MQELISYLKEKKLTLSTAESLTGGMFAEYVTSFSGVSSFFKGGIVSYFTEVKERILNVPLDVINEHGVVSYQTAEYMAKGVKELLNTDIAISFTGNAGPEVMENKAVGEVYIGIAYLDKIYSKKYLFTGSREDIRKSCIVKGIKFLKNILIEK